MLESGDSIHCADSETHHDPDPSIVRMARRGVRTCWSSCARARSAASSLVTMTIHTAHA